MRKKPCSRQQKKRVFIVESCLNVGFSKCHGPCSVTFFLKNNQRMALTESPMMAASPLFSATIITGHPHQTYIRAPSEYFPYSDTTNKTCILIIVITNQHHVLSTAAQPEPHHAPHMFHVPGQSHHTCTSLEVMSLSVTTSTDSGFTAVTGASQYLIMPKHMSKELAEPMNINWKTSSIHRFENG